MADDSRRIGELEDEIKQRDRRIAELKQEGDELRDIVHRMNQSILEDARNVLEQSRDVFDMELTDEGWSWKPFWDEH